MHAHQRFQHIMLMSIGEAFQEQPCVRKSATMCGEEANVLKTGRLVRALGCNIVSTKNRRDIPAALSTTTAHAYCTKQKQTCWMEKSQCREMPCRRNASTNASTRKYVESSPYI